jgi:hypothetical protein
MSCGNQQQNTARVRNREMQNTGGSSSSSSADDDKSASIGPYLLLRLGLWLLLLLGGSSSGGWGSTGSSSGGGTSSWDRSELGAASINDIENVLASELLQQKLNGLILDGGTSSLKDGGDVFGGGVLLASEDSKDVSGNVSHLQYGVMVVVVVSELSYQHVTESAQVGGGWETSAWMLYKQTTSERKKGIVESNEYGSVEEEARDSK